MLNGKTALVTGSTSGIGLSIAEALAKEGANIILNGFGDEAEINRLRARLAATYHVSVRYDGADMSKADAIEGMMKSAIAEFGTVDVLVNNAGVLHVAAVDELPLTKWDVILAIDLCSVFHTTRLALPAMKAKGWGRIINIASALALVGLPGMSAYAAAKHGVAGFTKTVALEVAKQAITVNAVCPGYVRTPLVEKEIRDTARGRGISETEAVRDALSTGQATMTFVAVEEVAALTVFLASDAATSITGAVIPIEGGWTAR
jgi:3-hydroxybutyrate dehydrogenase